MRKRKENPNYLGGLPERIILTSTDDQSRSMGLKSVAVYDRNF